MRQGAGRERARGGRRGSGESEEGRGEERCGAEVAMKVEGPVEGELEQDKPSPLL